MGFLNWIKGEVCRGSNPPAPLSFDEWLATNPIKNAETVQRHLDREIAALLAFAEGQQQAQSPQLPPPGAEPVATDEELMNLWKHPLSFSPNDARRAIYARGRADERTAILRALGMEP
jgi:hypothetical protein